MGLSYLAIRRPIATAMIALLVLLLGVVALRNLALDLLPNINLPVAVVLTNYPGAGPAEVENLVTRPLEEALGTINNIKSLRSESLEEASVVIAEFNWGTGMDFAALEMREKVDQVKAYLPDDAQAPMVLKIDPSMMAVMELSVAGGADLAQLRGVATEVIKGRLERLDGVARVDVVGGAADEVQVIADLARLQGYGVALTSVAGALRMENLNLPGGRVEEGKQKLLVRTMGEFESLDDIRRVSVPTPDGAAVTVGDVTQVRVGPADADRIARLDGRPSVGLLIQKRPDANTVRVSRQVLQVLDELRREVPPGIEVGVSMNAADFVVVAVNAVTSNAISGALLAIAILFLFLFSLRSTLVIALAIPISIIATFTLMYFSRLTLNLMSLGGLALGVGMLVDNSIVVLENIFRHRHEVGEDPALAAGRGGAEVATAITASTLTTVVVFLPIAFLQGIASELFRELALTVSFSLLASLVVALTVVPALASRLLTGATPAAAAAAPPAAAPWRRSAVSRLQDSLKDLTEGRLRRGYRRLLEGALRRRWLVLAGVAAAFVATVAMTPLISVEFIPSMDTGQFVIDVELPAGSPLAETDRVVRAVEERLAGVPEVEMVFSTSGGSGGMMSFGEGGGSNQGALQVQVVGQDLRRRSIEAIVDDLRADLASIPGARIEARPFTGFVGAMGGAPVQVSIKGDDLGTLTGLAEAAAERIRSVAGTREVASSVAEGQPELQLRVDRQRAAFYGLNVAAVAAAVRTAVRGDVATRYRVGGKEIDVRVRAGDEARASAAALGDLTIVSSLGAPVRLGDVADVTTAKGPTAISRAGQARAVTVEAQVAGRSLGSVTADIKRALAGLDLPPGYSIEYGGTQQQMGEAFVTLYQAAALAIVLVYMVMAVQYESLLYPLVIMFTMPLAFVGVIWALLLARLSLGVMALVGMIMLAGIVVNNAIVLVDYLNQLRARGMARREAILQAGVTRLRPILMTALTTILGLLPLALGGGEGGEMERPLAIVVMAGLTCSTALTLVVIPLVYDACEDIVDAARRRRKGVAGVAQPES